jgi:hypothetical protein
MDRDFSPREPEDPERDPGESGTRAADRQPESPAIERIAQQKLSPDRAPDERQEQPNLTNERVLVYDRDRSYSLSASEVRTIVELGKFRVIATQNLVEHAYRNDRERAGRDLQKLLREGLVRKGIFEGPEAHPRELLTLTKRGHRLVRKNRLAPEGQTTFSGFVKPREANHDADLYLLYQKEAQRIESLGGRNLRVILDYELKRKLNRDFAKSGTAARQAIAERHGLQVVQNKIPVPDLRSEYESRDGEMARVSLELVTEHYRGRHVAEKVRARFSLYTPRGEADHHRRVLDQSELTAEILYL